MNKLVQNIFIRGLALCYFFALGSLCSQIKALIGANGILPASLYLDQLANKGLSFIEIPTIFWFSSNDTTLLATCLVGILISMYLIFRKQSSSFDFIEFISLSLLYLIYLSFINIGQDFLSFQWDILLLETGFLTALFSLFKTNDFANKTFTWLFRFLIFKLMFMSGLVKISSNDSTWTNLTALNYHYYTQPIPNPISYFVHQLPSWFHKLSVAIMFVIELIIPFFIFCRKKLREFAALSFVLLQVMIIVTGNYCFFNLLSILLCLWLVDDSSIEKFIPEKVRILFTKIVTMNGSIEIINSFIHTRLSSLNSIDSTNVLIQRLSKIFIIAFAVISTSLSCYFTFSRSPIDLQTRINVVKAVSPIVKPLRYYFINNAYGLFASMTTRRTEIVFQGANEDKQWKDYELYYKPQNPQELPKQVAPHQPRLDWQMWFAALRPRPPIWFIRLAGKLLEGNQDILELFKTNPFPDKAPKYIRAVAYDYQFTSFDEYSENNQYWKTKQLGIYLPAMTLK